MPKKPDKSLKTDAGLYRSQIKASEKYDATKVDSIRLRVPKGWKEQMQQYVAQSEEYASINAMVCDLIKKEMGIELDNNE